ncbi:MAG: hypothetical protein DCF32_00470 [Leptolyngbya sp.]|nr:MAG: hypothetical protein DCF32_00470 [Leptolyngbya sp.]
MAQHLKRWESPRKLGRNDKGRGGAARQRQLQKRQQTLRKRLGGRSPSNPDMQQKGESVTPLFAACLTATLNPSQSVALLQGTEQRTA